MRDQWAVVAITDNRVVAIWGPLTYENTKHPAMTNVLHALAPTTISIVRMALPGDPNPLRIATERQADDAA